MCIDTTEDPSNHCFSLGLGLRTECRILMFTTINLTCSLYVPIENLYLHLSTYTYTYTYVEMIFGPQRVSWSSHGQGQANNVLARLADGDVPEGVVVQDLVPRPRPVHKGGSHEVMMRIHKYSVHWCTHAWMHTYIRTARTDKYN